VTIQATRIIAPERARRALWSNRLFQRQRFALRVKVTVPMHGSLRALYGSTRDISSGGMGVELVTAEALPLETPVLVTMRLPGTPHELNLTGFVTHRKGLSYGLRFSGLTREQKVLVRRICLALSTRMAAA
jgi:c-di-GMP-binding flagellar brake protein YcgR